MPAKPADFLAYGACCFVPCCRGFLLPACSPLSSWDTLFAIGYFYIYASDVLLNFCVAYYSEEGELVTDMRSIASEQ
jgi:hypothetical protein